MLIGVGLFILLVMMIWFLNVKKFKRPARLWIAQSLHEPEQQSLKKIENLLHAQWTEEVIVDPSLDKQWLALLCEADDSLPQISVAEYNARLDEISKKCVIRFLDPAIGWVVTLRAGQTLGPGFLTCYTGLLTSQALKKNASYETREYFFSLFQTENEEIGVDAKSHGNIGRLLPFFLEKEHLDNFTMSDAVRNRIATANCYFQTAMLNKKLMPCIFIKEKLCAPADKELLLGVNYSLKYLLKMQQENKKFRFLDQKTFELIDPNFYTEKMIRIELEGLNYEFELSRLRIMIAKYFPDVLLSTEGFNAEKKARYKISVSNRELYEAFIQSREETIRVKPRMATY